MNYSSHRLRAQERNSSKKLIWSVVVLLGSILFAVFIGLPILARLAVFISLVKKSDNGNKENISVSLFSPLLDPIPSATNSASLAVYGASDRDRKIILYLNDEKTDEVETNDEGKFSFRGVKLKEGNNKIAVSTKYKDQESQPATTDIVFKKEPPKLEITEPDDGQKILGEAKISIKGHSDPATRISINDRFIIVNRDGTFSYPVTLKEGENSFKFKVTDDAGNSTDKEIKINYSP